MMKPFLVVQAACLRFAAGASAGRGGLSFTVTDADGTTWTRQFALGITGS